MDILRDNEEMVFCPYNKAHHIRKYRMEVHLTKCRQSYPESGAFGICDFNATHRLPKPELQFHHKVCPDRKVVELQVYREHNACAPLLAVEMPKFPIPIDTSWDDDEVPTYDPAKYCQANKILRHIDGQSAAKRRDFRLAERQRFKEIEAREAENNPREYERNRILKARENDNLPPATHGLKLEGCISKNSKSSSKNFIEHEDD